MLIDHERRAASFALGELAAFTTGPRAPEGGPSGRWRAEIGTHWHREKRAALKASPSSDATAGRPLAAVPSFELPVRGALAHRGWLFQLEGRLDQSLPAADGAHRAEKQTLTG